MITLAIIAFCIVLMFAVAAARGHPGRAVADTSLLVILIGMIALADIVASRFLDTGETASQLAILFASGFALDAVYGLMAPERQKRRDRRLRRLMKRRA